MRSRFGHLYDDVKYAKRDQTCPICGKAYYDKFSNKEKKQFEFKHRFPVKSARVGNDGSNNRLLRTEYCYMPMEKTA